MPLAGGDADKVGNRYEGLWTATVLLRVLHEELRSIYLEPVGPEGDGVEFIVTQRDGVKEYHQVKRQYSGFGAWTLAALASKRVLQAIGAKLSADEEAQFVFVSMSGTPELQELSEMARDARSAAEFVQHFTTASKVRSGSLAVLCELWGGCHEEEAFHRLRRIRVETVAENTLRREAEYRASTLTEGNPATVIDVLAQFALGSIHKELSATSVRDHLTDRGIQRRVWVNDSRALALIEAQNERYLNLLRQTYIFGEPIPRDETQTILQALQTDGARRFFLVSGGAGGGKSGIVAAILDAVRAWQWPVLVVRLDRLDGETTAKQFGTNLGLPDSPAITLARFAGDRPNLLVIDQLDAVSQSSGRNPQRFDIAAEILAQCNIHPRMRVVMACRHFDLQNDSRLRSFVGEQGIAQEVPVGMLSPDAVDVVVARCGGDAAMLTDKQRAFLAVPLNLKLFSEVASENNMGTTVAYDTLQGLYDAYWECKQRDLRQRLGRDSRWTEVVDALTERMTRVQTLSVPLPVLDRFGDVEAKAFLSEGVLVRDGKRVAFFHETFFDYCFARRFLARGERLLPFLRAGEDQPLFLRAAVRQLLAYERGDDFGQYLSDVGELLAAPDVRFHVKRVVLRLLNALPDPTEQEARLMLDLADIPTGDPARDDDLCEQAWQALLSPAWLYLLDRIGFIQKELHADDPGRIARIVHYIGYMARGETSAYVAGIALGMAERPEPWPAHARTVLSWARMESHPDYVELYKRLLSRGYLAEETARDHPFASNSGYFLHDLSKQKPEWAIDVFAAWLRYRIEQCARSGQDNPLSPPQTDDSPQSSWGRDYYADTSGNDLAEWAKVAPAAFVEQLLPLVLRIVVHTAAHEDPAPRGDTIWRYRCFGSRYSLPAELEEALVTALVLLAAEDPEAFVRLAEAPLKAHLDYETAGFLLAKGYTGNGAVFAERAATFLLADDAWLQLGYSDSSFWVSRQLLDAITPHVSDDTLQRLEDRLLTFETPHEKDKDSRRWRGYSQQALLNGIAPSRRSRAVERRLGELARKLGVADDEPPRGIQGGFIGSPIQADQAKLRDEDWIGIATKYTREEARTRRFADIMRSGGPDQVASDFQRHAKQEPERFARILLRLPQTTEAVYFERILWGIAEAVEDLRTAPPELIWDTIRYVHSLPGRPCGRFLGNVIERYGEHAKSVPDDVLRIAVWYATEHPDPDPDASGFGGDLLTHGLNTVRGGMMGAVASLLWKDAEHYFPFFEPYLDQMVADPSMAVRSRVAQVLQPVLNIDRDRAADLLSRLCDVQPEHDVLLATHHVCQTLAYLTSTHFQRAEPLLVRMVASPDPSARKAGAQILTLAATWGNQAALALAEPLCVRSGDATVRAATADLLATVLTNSHTAERSFCEESLVRFFDDEAESVRKEAADCFRAFRNNDALADYLYLAEAFVDSRAFGDDTFSFFQMLKTTTTALPEIVLVVFERSIELMRSVPPGERVRTGRFVDRDSSLLLRFYEQTEREPALRRRTLDVIDALARCDTYNLEQTLAAGERGM
jgi:hypothetical protein